MVTQINDELFSMQAIADPYTYYGTLRELDPVHWNAKYEQWMITRYEDVVWFIRHPEIFSSESTQRDPRPPSPPINPAHTDDYKFMQQFRNNDFIRRDPPDHTRMRSAINKSFTPKLVEEWRPMVREVINDLLDQVAGKGKMDLMADVAAPLPMRVIVHLLGIPQKDREHVREMASRRMASDVSLSPDRMHHSAQGIKETCAYLTPYLEARMKEPTGDLLSQLVAAEMHGTYSRDEVQANAQGLVDAGHETTIKLLSNGTLAFMNHPDQWALFKSDPEGLAVSATEECLRYDPPLVTIRRITARDVEYGGKQLHKGERVFWVIASANRDPRVFKDPDAFDIKRSPNHHVAFGSGIHYCLGQYLARMEGQELFKALARRFPSLRLTGPVEYNYARSRGMKALWLTWN